MRDGKVTQSLATWSSTFLRQFQTKSEVASVMVAKLEDWDKDDRRYVARFFFRVLPSIDDSETYVHRCTDAIVKAIKDGDEHIREAVLAHATSFPEAWTSRLVAGLVDLTDKDNPGVVLRDGTPLLKAPEKSDDLDDDIPF